jgi:hypothetical protein
MNVRKYPTGQLSTKSRWPVRGRECRCHRVENRDLASYRIVEKRMGLALAARIYAKRSDLTAESKKASFAATGLS